jgi:hypothetical protein
MLNKQLSAIPLLLLSSAVFAGTFQANDARTNGMGGAGVAAADPVSAGALNPALLSAYEQDEDFGLVLPSLGVFVEDPKGFVEAITTFLEDDFPAYENLDFSALPTQIGDLSTQAGAVNTAVLGYGTTHTINDVTDEQALLTTEINNTRTEVDSVDVVISTTEENFEGFSNKPMQSGFLASAGFSLPGQKSGIAFNATYNSYFGAQLSLSTTDLAALSNTTSDTNEYLDRLETMNSTLSDFVAAAQYCEDTPLDCASSGQTGFDNLAAAETAFTAAVTALDNETTNGIYNPGNTPGFDSASASSFNFDNSSVQLLGVNIAEVSGSYGTDMNLFGEDITAGVRVKLQSLSVFDNEVTMNEFEDDPEGTTQDAVNNSKSYTTGNLDIGVAKNFDYKGTLTTALVIRDVIPQDFKSAGGRTISFKPQVRVGLAHKTGLTTLAADLDITENEPVAYGVASRYLALGAEFNAWNFAKVRTGYRTNLSESNASIVSFGAAFTPFGAGLDLSVWAKPSSDATEMFQDAGGVLQLSVNF